MNKGFRIEIQKDLTPEEDIEARKMANKFPSDYKERHESSAFFRRGKLGLPCNDKDFNLYIRRASTHRRIFHIVREDTLELVQCKQNEKILFDDDDDGTYTVKYDYIGLCPTKIDMCMCAVHKGGLRVKLKKPIETYIYREEGIIKG